MKRDELLKRDGLMLVVSSPSGAGKTTLTRKLLTKYNDIKLSVSMTTRPKRVNEIDGTDYHFIDEARFQEMVEQQAFLEYAKVFNHHYGTPRAPVDEALQAGIDVLFDIDWNGTQQLKKNTDRALVTVFILPPTSEALVNRLETRALDSTDTIHLRMNEAANEMSHFNEYGYIIINDDLGRALSQIENILLAERLKRIRHPNIKKFVSELSYPELQK